MCRGIAIKMTCEEARESFKANYNEQNEYFAKFIREHKNAKLSFIGKIVKGQWYFFAVLSNIEDNKQVA